MSNYNASIGGGSWFNKIKQGDNEGGKLPFWKVVGAFLAALAAVATIIGVLIALGIISVNV